MRAFFGILIFLFFQQSIAAGKIALIVTSMGTIRVRLHDNTPRTVENFVKLAKGEQRFIDKEGRKALRPFYNGLEFHRIEPKLGIFAGCQWGTGRGWPGYYLFDENPGESQFDRPGLVAMAKLAGDNRVGSQFFITTTADDRLNGKYTIFGEVDGDGSMDVVRKIANAPRDEIMKPKPTITIKTVEIKEQ